MQLRRRRRIGGRRPVTHEPGAAGEVAPAEPVAASRLARWSRRKVSSSRTFASGTRPAATSPGTTFILTGTITTLSAIEATSTHRTSTSQIVAAPNASMPKTWKPRTMQRRSAEWKSPSSTMTPSSRPDTGRSFEEFDFAFQSSIRREQVLHLGQLDFLHGRENVILLGPPGTGKTHLAIALGIRACLAGHRVAFRTATEWVAMLADAQRHGRLDSELDKLVRIPLLICDEVGYG
jgi:chromosomal replication initiation ATPase DnaA